MRTGRAVALGLLHGPLELLPVSSSAHVALLAAGHADGAAGKELEVALHAGTLLALGPPRPRPWLVLATAPAALAGALLEDAIEQRLGTRGTLPAGLLLGAAALALADQAPRRRGRPRPGTADALAVGLAQAAALVPGVSRHGAALAAARARGFDRPAAHAVSRTAGLPVLAGATALKGWRVARRRPGGAELVPLLAGAAASALSTRVAAAGLPATARAPLWPFAAYRALLATAMMAGVPRPPIPLAGRTVAVTGAARGIGRALTAELARRGARVVSGDRDPTEPPPGVTALSLDVTDEASFAAFLDRAAAEGDGLHALVNNAGVLAVGPLETATAEGARREVEVNLLGVATGSRLALARGARHIVNVASSAGRFATPGIATYTATKHGVVGLTEALRAELRGRDVDLSVVLPGPVETEMIAGTHRSRFVRVVAPEDVARAIADALERPRFEVWVPRELGALHRMLAPLPIGARQWVARRLEADRIYTEVDHAQRAGYDARTEPR